MFSHVPYTVCHSEKTTDRQNCAVDDVESKDPRGLEGYLVRRGTEWTSRVVGETVDRGEGGHAENKDIWTHRAAIKKIVTGIVKSCDRIIKDLRKSEKKVSGSFLS